MQLPRSGQLDVRRRRVLTDDVIGASEASAAAPASPLSRARRAVANSRPYGDAALIDKQPRVTDLVPQRYGIIVLFFLAGLTAVAGLEALYVWMPDLAMFSVDGRVAAFDLDAEGSLAAWFASTTLTLAALVSVLVFSIRRHKADDYHGRYRIWLWAAACWLAMSVDEGSSLHEGFKELMVHVTGQHGFGDGSIWWIGAYLLVLGVVGLRLLLEMRECRLSTTLLLLTAACYVAAIAAELGWLVPQGGPRAVMIEEGCELTGNWFLLLAMTLHARYVLLAAQGMLPRKRAKPVKPPKALGAAKNGAESKALPQKTADAKVATAPKVVAAAKAEAPRAAEAAQKKSWFGRAKIDPAHASPPAPSKKADVASARTATAALKTDARKAAVVDDDDFEYDDGDGDGERKGKPGGRSHDADIDAHQRRMSKAERKALRRQQRDRDDE
ncbi:MAG TPA: hypothetical protein VND64_31560 [Pirellulales bacterium]|nr:hypothetical protein [Pirellulales bacterium]